MYRGTEFGTKISDTELRELGGAYTKQVGLLHGKRVIVKPAVSGAGGAYLSEVMADTIDNLLGWNIVPPTVGRTFSPKHHWFKHTDPNDWSETSIQEWMRGTTTLSEYIKKTKKLGDWGREFDAVLGEFIESQKGVFQRIIALDIIIGNTDRHTANVIVSSKGKVWAIDNANSFPSWKYFWPYNRTLYNYVKGPIAPDILRDLSDLEEGDLRAAVAPAGPGAVEGAVYRWKKLLEKKFIPTGETWKEFFDDEDD